MKCFLILVLAENFTASVKKKRKASKHTKTFHIMCHMLFWYHLCSCLGNLPPILAICPESGACPSVWDPLCYESIVALQSCYWHSASRRRKEISALWDGKKQIIAGRCRTAQESSYLQLFAKSSLANTNLSHQFECFLLKLCWLVSRTRYEITRVCLTVVE